MLFLWPEVMNAQPQFPAFYFVPVPNELEASYGNTNSGLPFAHLGPVRYQQVYDASQFSKLPAGGAFLSVIFLRASCLSQRNWRVTNLQVNMSTTSKGSDQLSPTFAENIGADETTGVTSTNWAPPSSCSGYDFGSAGPLRLDVPFFYDPARGNLLVDIRNSGIDWDANPGPLWESLLDAQNVLGDSVSRAVAFSLSTNTAEVVDSVGLATAFQFYPTPTLYVRYETDSVILTWPTKPKPFRLQWSDTAGPGTAWSDYSGSITGNDLWQQLVLPVGSIIRPKFFRLFWNTPQPLPAPAVSPAVQVDAVIKP